MELIWQPAAMHNFSNRLNAVVTFASLVITLLIAFNIATAFYSLEEPTIDLSLSKVERLMEARNDNQLALLRFNLKADLRPAWTWNTNIFYVSVAVEYVTDKNVVNQRVIWDKQILKKEDAVFDLQDQKASYHWEDQGKGLLGNTANLTFNWNYLPLSGVMWLEKRGHKKMTFPTNYV